MAGEPPVDSTPPTVTNVTSSTANGSYTQGDAIDIQVVFSEAVTVTGTPQLTLETGVSEAVVNYASGSGTTTLTFNYTVAAGHTSADLDYVSTTALALNRGTILDTAGNAATLTLVAPGAAGSLGANKNLIIDIGAKTQDVVSPGIPASAQRPLFVPGLGADSGAILIAGLTDTNGEVGATQRVKIVDKGYQVFDNLTGASAFGPLDISTIWAGAGGDCETGGRGDAVVLYDRLADRWVISQFASAPGGNAVTEECFAVSTTSDATGSYYRYAFHLGGNFIDSPHLSVRPDGYLMGDSVYNESGTERLGNQFFVFDRTAMLTGAAATFTSPGLDTGVGETYSISAQGVRLASAPLETAASTLTINLTYDPDSTFTSAGLTAQNITDMKAANAFAAAQFTNNFSDPINVNIRVTAVPGTGTLGQSSTSLTSTTFANLRAKTLADATTADDMTATGGGGSVPAADPIGGTHTYFTSRAQAKALGVTADSGTTPSDGTYTFGGGWSYTYDPNNRAVSGKIDYIGVSMHEFSEIMGRIGLMGQNLDGNPDYMQFDWFHYTGAGTRGLNNGAGRFFSINNGTTLLKAFNNAAVNGGDLQDWASGTNDSFNAFSSSGVKNDMTAVDLRNMDVIGYNGDGVAPTVTNVTSSTANGSYKQGDTIPIQVVFSEAVTVTGTPQLTLETGVSDAVVNYASGSGTTTLTFNYTVAAGHTSADLDYVSTTALALNGGTILDAAGNAAILTLAAPGTAGSLGANKNLVIDTTAPTVTNVTSSTANGSYKQGDTIAIQVVFSETLTVTGTPQLTLETGASDAVVNYASGSGTATLTFNYTIAAGHTSADLDYASTTALALNGGTIRDTAGNAAILTLAAPGTAGSLGANKNLVVDTTVPAVMNVTSTKADGSYGVGVVIPIQMVFSEAVTVTGTPQLTLETGASDAVVNYASGSGTATLTFNYTVAAGHTSADLDYVSTTALALNGGTIRDTAGNAAILTLAAPGSPGSLGFNKNLVIDTRTVPGPPTNLTGTPGDTTVTLSWMAPASDGGAAITGYRVQAATSAGGPYADAVGCPTNSTTPSCTATGLTNGTAYFFKVAASNAVGIGLYSSVRVVNGFTDHPLTAGTTIKAVHITELRSLIDALRLFFGTPSCPLPTKTWTDQNPSGVTAKAVHVQEMRDALTEAYDCAIAAGRSVTRPSFTDDPLIQQSTTLKAIHITELRAAVVALEAQE